MSSGPTPRPLYKGDKILHAHNRELGPGIVEETTPTRITVHFPRAQETLVFAAANHPFVPLTMKPGAADTDWLEEFQDTIVERLARVDGDGFDAFLNRYEALKLTRLREADGLGSFLGGRIDLLPHQLHVAENATRRHPVRWLLADEVGLGKTVEACLILNHLLRTGAAERVIAVAPRSLVVQWLGELWRKFHHVFVLIDDERRQDVRKEQGPGFNPFDVYDRTVVALEDLVEDPALARLAQSARPDMLVVDEAHRLRRRRGTAGTPEYRALAPLTGASKHVLLLSATPVEGDAHGFFRLLQLLHPQQFEKWEAFEEGLRNGTALFQCASSTNRQDIGGLPPRRPAPVDLPPSEAQERAELQALGAPGNNAAQLKARREQLARALSMPTGSDDPRIAWLGEKAREWDRNDEKTLVFVASRDALVPLKRELEYFTSRRVAVFHEDLSPAQRDLEVARFTEEDGPNVLLATESGGEGRNFQFARRLVLFDLPWDPVVVEQRIGRLDRINRRLPVEIVYFRPPSGFGREVVRLHEALGVFERPLGGLERALGHVVEAVEENLDHSAGHLDVEAVAAETREVHQRIVAAAYHDMHRARYRPELAEEILARVPEDLERRTQQVVLEACRQFGFDIEPKGGSARWYLEFGSAATVETLHGVPPDSRYLGTFDREEAVQRESLDFFAAGHPLVEGILFELSDGDRGRVAFVEVAGEVGDSWGVLTLTRQGADFQVRALDPRGRERPEWIARVLEARTVREVSAGAWGVADWSDRVRPLLSGHAEEGDLVAACGVRFRTATP